MSNSQPNAREIQALKARILSDWLRQRIAQEYGDIQPNSDKMEERQGAICAQWKRCGRPNCRCARRTARPLLLPILPRVRAD